MTSISSLSGTNSTSSIYGTRNVISGLASGMDTETLIENAVSGYKTKITQLQQKQEMVQWKQEAYRSIIDKMVGLTRKYTSYTSNTNLFSQNFFNKAVTTSAQGANASKVSASGKTSSDVQINAIKQLATNAKRTINVANTSLAAGSGVIDGNSVTSMANQLLNLDGKTNVSNIQGGMTLTYGNSSIYLNFEELEAYTSAEELAKGIEDKLAENQIRTGSGEYVAASDRIGVKVENGVISFEDKANAGNSIFISSADSNIQQVLGFKAGSEVSSSNTSLKVGNGKSLYTEKNTRDYLAGKTVDFTLDGVTKSVTLTKDALKDNDSLVSHLNNELKNKFGEGKIQVSLKEVNGSDGNKLGDALAFETKKGSTFSATSTSGKALGFGDNGVTSYLNTGNSLSNLLGADKFSNASQEAEVNLSDLMKLSGKSINVSINGQDTQIDLGEVGYTATAAEVAERINQQLQAKGLGGSIKASGEGSKLTFKSGYDNDSFTISSGDKSITDFTTDSKGYLGLTVNGQEFKFGEDSTMQSVLNKINNSDAGVEISYSKLTNEFAITAKESGVAGNITMSGDLAGMFGFDADGTDQENATIVKGQDAIFNVTVNGSEMELTRSSNTVDLDGMSVTLKDKFGYNEDGTIDKTAEPITFETKTDTDSIVDVIKTFVEDYNALVTEVHNAYSTQPNEKSSTDHSRYMPLTDDDKNTMSDSAIEAYEAKAKQGILFGSTELSSLYRRLTSVVQMTGDDYNTFSKMGITTGYSNGLTTLQLDENALREALESDPDGVRDAFSRSVDSGASSNGLMYNMKQILDTYAGTSSANPGVLISMAGSAYSPTSVNDNQLQKQYNEYTTQIEKWQDKMSDKVDYYTKQFTALEQLISQMNSQSSMLSGLMGGY